MHDKPQKQPLKVLYKKSSFDDEDLQKAASESESIIFWNETLFLNDSLKRLESMDEHY